MQWAMVGVMSCPPAYYSDYLYHIGILDWNQAIMIRHKSYFLHTHNYTLDHFLFYLLGDRQSANGE